MIATYTHATIELLKAVFSLQSVLRLYDEEQLRSQESLETALRRVGVSCETVTNMSTEAEDIVGLRQQVTTDEDTAD
jgi:DNA-directed RNA polymerase sigma subunit (sigma70/sigma32)